ncbi:hypothetical protein [Anaerotruncus sp. AF02-27]|uniref:hypothetical protein n=1 Tax=Anaerotruncus sp. AF02-27 TaxID=2292191 RepID=UPI0013148591|nr:hypothetical protein [Anaerotruncus sp. AF02-27]
MRKLWTRAAAQAHYIKVQTGRAPHDLAYCSACDYLKKPARAPEHELKRQGIKA